jgi:outer membrane protein assembly factor BamB
MKSYPTLKRGLLGGATALIFVAVLAVVWLNAPRPQAKETNEARSWPLFGGTVNRNLVNLVEKGIADEWDVTPDKQKNIKWSVEMGTKAYGGPVVAGGKIFVGTNNDNPRDPNIKGDKGVLMCFNEADGKFLWQAVHDKLGSGQVNDWPREGICSSPVVDGNRLYYVSNRCEVVCASTEDGKAIWTLDMIGKLNVFPHNLATCSPLLVGDTLFVITSNGVHEDHLNIPRPEAPSFLAINKKDGAVKWSSNLPSIALVEARKQGGRVDIKKLVDAGKVLMHGQWSNPVYAEPNGTPMIIFPGGDGWVYAFKPDSGELIWKFDCNPKKSVYKLGGDGTRNDFVCTPVIWENKLYIGVGQDPEHDKGVGHMWCIDITKKPTNKDKDVSPVNDNFDPKAAVNKDSALVWHYGGDAPEDAERSYLFGRTMSTCAIHDGLCYAGEYDGWLHCFDARTGKELWSHDTGNNTWSSPYWVDGRIYFGNENGKVNIFEHGKTKKLIREVNVRPRGKSTRVRTTPVACNGTLYLMTEAPCKLYAIKK